MRGLSSDAMSGLLCLLPFFVGAAADPLSPTQLRRILSATSDGTVRLRGKNEQTFWSDVALKAINPSQCAPGNVAGQCTGSNTSLCGQVEYCCPDCDGDPACGGPDGNRCSCTGCRGCGVGHYCIIAGACTPGGSAC